MATLSARTDLACVVPDGSGAALEGQKTIKDNQRQDHNQGSAAMSTDESYNGWTNRETWAVALHINNDQGWQESVFEALRGATIEDRPASLRYGNAELDAKDDAAYRARQAGEIVRENVEAIFDIEAVLGLGINGGQLRDLWMAREDIGSLYRVNWDELGASFLEDLKDVDGS